MFNASALCFCDHESATTHDLAVAAKPLNGGGQIQSAFATARARAGLGPDVTPHILRHTWATWFYAQTRDFGRMLDLGGWRTTSTAERYRKIAPADLAARLDRAGWDFRVLGADLPARDRGRAGGAHLRLVP